MTIIDTIKEIYELKGMGAPKYYPGSDFDTNLKILEEKEVQGIRETDHSVKEKKLFNIWLKHSVRQIFSARTYIKEIIDRLETMVRKEFVEKKEINARDVKS